jgi:uncharacterized protein YbaR (Trm112 family)
MTLSAELVMMLACPRCKGPLTLESREVPRASIDAREEEPLSEDLCCARCELAYPIREGVPELLSSEARPRVKSGR